MKIHLILILLFSVPFSSFSSEDAFQSPSYSEKSAQELIEGEMTVSYTYPSNPCGTLMTEFISRGSVRVGRGPVYELAANVCRRYDRHMVPNDFSFRTFACRNGRAGDIIQGSATFAFFCGYKDGDTVCSPERNKNSKEIDWNCGGIIKKKAQLIPMMI